MVMLMKNIYVVRWGCNKDIMKNVMKDIKLRFHCVIHYIKIYLPSKEKHKYVRTRTKNFIKRHLNTYVKDLNTGRFPFSLISKSA